MYALDLTPVFDQLLVSKAGKPTTKQPFDVVRTDGFLKEAYRINSFILTLSKQLSDVRQAYLSSAPPRPLHHTSKTVRGSNAQPTPSTGLTDEQRDAIDANAKRMLRELNASIRALAEAEALHQETQQVLIRKRFAGPTLRLPGLGTISVAGATSSSSSSSTTTEQAAAEEAQKQAAAHHESVLWYLRQRLQACGKLQQFMMEARVKHMWLETTLARQHHAMLVDLGVNALPPGAGAGRAALDEEDSRRREKGQPGQAPEPDDGLTAEQIQMFERDNQDLLKLYETTLDKVRAAEQSLVEISELQTMLVSNLEIQSAHVDQMVADSVSTAENVTKGNRELKKALDRPSTARYTFFAAGGLCLFVIVWDFFV